MQRCSLGRCPLPEAVLLTRETAATVPDPRITAPRCPRCATWRNTPPPWSSPLGLYFGQPSADHAVGQSNDPQAWDGGLRLRLHRHPGPTCQPVGNGGFHWCSRRLIDALQDADIRETQPEDHVICLDYHTTCWWRGTASGFCSVDVGQPLRLRSPRPSASTSASTASSTSPGVMPDAELQAWLAGAERSVLLSMPGRRLLEEPDPRRAPPNRPGGISTCAPAATPAAPRHSVSRCRLALRRPRRGPQRRPASPDAPRRYTPPAAIAVEGHRTEGPRSRTDRHAGKHQLRCQHHQAPARKPVTPTYAARRDVK